MRHVRAAELTLVRAGALVYKRRAMGILDHLGIVVSDDARARAFYDRALAPG